MRGKAPNQLVACVRSVLAKAFSSVEMTDELSSAVKKMEHRRILAGMDIL